ncbi:MAG: 50S ribosomal protein L18 [Saprospiraceae bacterium]|nr:50S ribosomal protein L18 [Saprospiraceae bacterium]
MKMTLKERRARIHRRIRKKVSGTAATPRLAVYRSNKAIYCQLIDDTTGHTLGAATSIGTTGTKVEQAHAVGLAIAGKAKEAGIIAASFDRGGYLYHGRIKALAEGAREGGLAF